MNLQQELRHKSEDIDDLVLLDVVKALRRRVRSVNRDYDVPYIAGYSLDGKTIFIDRHLPRTFRWLLKTVRVEQFLLTHEIVEKALLDELRLHQVAVRAERDAVKAAGISWWTYQAFMKKHEKPIEEEKLIRVEFENSNLLYDRAPCKRRETGLPFRIVRGHLLVAPGDRVQRCDPAH
jgi:hypothetical protein